MVPGKDAGGPRERCGWSQEDACAVPLPEDALPGAVVPASDQLLLPKIGLREGIFRIKRADVPFNPRKNTQCGGTAALPPPTMALLPPLKR